MHDYYSTRKKGASGVSMGTWELLPRANHEIAAKLTRGKQQCHVASSGKRVSTRTWEPLSQANLQR